MKNLQIEKTEDCPSVYFSFHENVYKMGGDSRPENPKVFYEPVISWIRELKAHLDFEADVNKDNPNYKKELIFEFQFDYLNSISIKFIYDLIKEIDALNEPKPIAKVIWHYNEGDELMKENGEDYAHMVKLEFILKEV